MDEVLLDWYKKLFQLNLDKKYVDDLIELINDERSQFSKIILNSKENLASLYKLDLR